MQRLRSLVQKRTFSTSQQQLPDWIGCMGGVFLGASTGLNLALNFPYDIHFRALLMVAGAGAGAVIYRRLPVLLFAFPIVSGICLINRDKVHRQRRQAIREMTLDDVDNDKKESV